MTRLRACLLVTLLACACSSSKEEPKPATPTPTPTPTPVPSAPTPAPAPAPEPSKNEVALTIDGAVSAKLEGTGGTCSLHKSGPMRGATWQVRSADFGAKPSFSLTIMGQPGHFANPAIVLDVTAPERANYARNRQKPDAKDRITLAEDATSADIDVTLHPILKGAPIHIKGTIKCSAPIVAP